MKKSPQRQIEFLVRSLEKKGSRAVRDEDVFSLASSQPEAVSNLAISVMRRFPKGGTFLDGAISYLPQDKWPELVQFALETLEHTSEENEAAQSVIEHASFQCPSALHSHLDRIFRIRPNKGRYYEYYPWRESGNQHLGFLRNVIKSKASTNDDRRRAWTALFATRHPMAIQYAISSAKFTVTSDWSVVESHLHLVGLHWQNRSLCRICPDSLYHLQFPKKFFDPQSRPPWLARNHPTWNLSESMQSVSFGGGSKNPCSLCGKKLHRLLVLEPIPPGLGITRLTRLELASCLSCLGWEDQPLFYRHDGVGSPSNIGYEGPSVVPQFPVGPLRKAKLGLARTSRRWYWQDWGSSNSRENLNRIGGEPSWVQGAEYPECPSCKKLMPFLFQLDSDLPTADGEEWLWGSGGIVYGFWCDKCKVSGLLWQCT